MFMYKSNSPLGTVCIRCIAENRIESFGNITQLRGLQILQAFMYAIPGLNFKNRKWYNYLKNQIYTLKSYNFFSRSKKVKFRADFARFRAKSNIAKFRAQREMRASAKFQRVCSDLFCFFDVTYGLMYYFRSIIVREGAVAKTDIHSAPLHSS